MLLEILQSARTSAGRSQADVARSLGVARLAIIRLEQGTGSVELLLAVMAELQLRISGVGRGKTLSEQLRASRLRRAWTIEHAAERSGLTRKTVSAIEAGQGSVASLIKLLSTLAPHAQATPAPRSSWAFDPRGLADRDQRFTPAWFGDHLTAAFGPISLDPCGHHLSPIAADRRIILPEDGLDAAWGPQPTVYVNPPYSALSVWLTKIQNEWERGEIGTMVVLVPARTDYAVFQTRISRDADVLFPAGRMRFDEPAGTAHAVPFSLMVLVYGSSDAAIEEFPKRVPSVRMRRWSTVQPTSPLS